MYKKKHVNQLRGALQNRGPQQGELFTSIQMEDLFPVGKQYSMPNLDLRMGWNILMSLNNSFQIKF